MQQEGASPGWRKANIEGPVYLIKRQKAPLCLGMQTELSFCMEKTYKDISHSQFCTAFQRVSPLYHPCLELSYQIIVKNQFSNNDLIDNLQLVRARVV